MAVLAAIVMAPLLLENDDLFAFLVLEHGRGDRSPGNGGLAGPGGGALADHEHVAELDLGARLAGQLLDEDDVVLGDFVLLAARANDCEHWENRAFETERTGALRRRPVRDGRHYSGGRPAVNTALA